MFSIIEFLLIDFFCIMRFTRQHFWYYDPAICFFKRFHVIFKVSKSEKNELNWNLFFNLRKPTPDAWRFSRNYDGVIDSFSIMAFAFMCHHNSFLIYNSMSKPTYSNWKSVSHFSISFSCFFSFLFGLVGYLTFTEHTEGQIKGICIDVA